MFVLSPPEIQTKNISAQNYPTQPEKEIIHHKTTGDKMKTIFILLFIFALIQDITNAQFVRVWEKSAAQNNLPSWFSPTGNRERGMAFCEFDGLPKLYVISNLAEPTVIILDAMTGDSLGTLNTEGIDGGILLLSDISARPDYNYPYSSLLYACNLTNNASISPFKIYEWESDTSAPQLLIENYLSDFRVGDHLNLGMDFDQHFITVSSNNNKLVDYYSSTGNPPFIRREIILSDGNTSNNASADYNWIYPFIYSGSYIVNSDGYLPKFYDTLGVLQFTSDSAVISSNSNSIKYHANGTLCCDLPFYVSYQYDENNAALITPSIPPWETFWGETPSLGNNPNPENYGDVEFAWVEWNELYIFVLSGNNGIGAYYAQGLVLPVELSSFTAENFSGGVILKWETATETNNSGFEVERSQMSKVKSQTEWQRIGFVEGQGTTTEIQTYSFTDKPVPGIYKYRLKQIDFDGTFAYSPEVEAEVKAPNVFSLEQNYPNPFNPSTKIKYTIPASSLNPFSKGEGTFVTLKVFDILGNEVATLVNEEQAPGVYEVEFSTSSGIRQLGSGIYLYQLKAGTFIETKKMILIK